MQLFIIRHAQSQNNALWARTNSDEGRSPDPPLTTLGHRQARFLASHLAHTSEVELVKDWDSHNRAGYGITHLYTSLMIRAVETGTYVAQALGLPLIGRTDIHERGGIWRWDEVTEERIGIPGPNRAYFEDHYPQLELPEEITEEGWWNKPFESDEEVNDRVRLFVADLFASHGERDDRVAIISHGGFINSLLGSFFKVGQGGEYDDGPKGLWFGTSNTGISRLRFGHDFVALVYLNRVDFLPPEVIT